jgi:hypothetical protein
LFYYIACLRNNLLNNPLKTKIQKKNPAKGYTDGIAVGLGLPK